MSCNGYGANGGRLDKVNNELMSLENLNIIDEATAKLKDWDIPWVQVDEPLEDVKISFVALLRVTGRGLLPAATEVALLEELMHIMAAKSGLITIKKLAGSDSITIEEERLIETLVDPALKTFLGVYCGTTSTDRRIVPEIDWWVQEDTVALLDVPAGIYFPFQPSTKILFNFRKAESLSKVDYPFARDFIDLAQNNPCEVTIEATEEVRDIVTRLEKEG